MINSLSSATGLTTLTLRHCYVALGDDDLTWGSLGCVVLLYCIGWPTLKAPVCSLLLFNCEHCMSLLSHALVTISFGKAVTLTQRLPVRHCRWPKNQLVRHLRGFAASLRRMTALQHLDLELELDDSGWSDEEDDAEPGASDVLTSPDLQPIVDAIVSLRSVESLSVRLVPAPLARCKAPLLSAAQKAALAAVAPKPESPYLSIP